MLSREENELLTRVGPGTAMGQLMRQYWMPVLLSAELEPGGRVKRVRLLGEDLVALRARDGKAGLPGEHCSHRRASLSFGRNRGAGLRGLHPRGNAAPECAGPETTTTPRWGGF